MSRTKKSIKQEIKILEEELTKTDLSPTSIQSDGVTVRTDGRSKKGRKIKAKKNNNLNRLRLLANRLDQLYMEYYRMNGAPTLLVRGIVKGLGSKKRKGRKNQ